MKFSSTLTAFKTSTFLQLLVLAIGTEAFISFGLPSVVQVMQPNLIGANAPLVKFRDYYGSKENPEVVIMGSSLVLAPAIHCDAAMLPASDPDKVRIRKAPSASYTRAKYLEGVLKEACGQDLTIYNLGLPGSMAPDNYAYLQEMITCKKRPALIVLGLAARDFVNRKRTDPEKSSLVAALKQFDKERKLSAANIFTELPTLVSEHFQQDKSELALVKALVDGKIKDWRTNGFEPATFAVKPEDDELQEVQLPTPKVLAEFKDQYVDLFDSAKPEALRTQLSYLDKMVSLAGDVKIPIVLVNLPVTDRHKELLTDELTTIYQNGIKEVATKNGCTLIDMDIPGEFDADTDFRDPIHLNAKGGRKFYKELVARLAAQHVLKESIASTDRKVQ